MSASMQLTLRQGNNVMTATTKGANGLVRDESDYADIAALRHVNSGANPRLMSAAMHDTRNNRNRIAIKSSSVASKQYIKRNVYGTVS